MNVIVQIKTLVLMILFILAHAARVNLAVLKANHGLVQKGGFLLMAPHLLAPHGGLWMSQRLSLELIMFFISSILAPLDVWKSII